MNKQPTYSMEAKVGEQINQVVISLQHKLQENA